MHPKEQLNADLKAAMRSGDETRKLIIREALAAIKEAEQARREELVKKALQKHRVARPNLPQNAPDYEKALAAYNQAVDAALAAEKVEAASILDEGETLAVIQRLIKQHQESLTDAEKANRPALAEAEKAKLAILQSYLPQQLSRQEIEAEARTVIAQVGASGLRDMGRVMGPLTAQLKGRADGKLISEVVKALLAE